MFAYAAFLAAAFLAAAFLAAAFLPADGFSACFAVLIAAHLFFCAAAMRFGALALSFRLGLAVSKLVAARRLA